MRRHSNLATGKWQSGDAYNTGNTDCTQGEYSHFYYMAFSSAGVGMWMIRKGCLHIYPASLIEAWDDYIS